MTDRRTILSAPVRTQIDLERAWRALMEPLGFSGSSLWLMLIGADDVPLTALTQLEDHGTVPTPEMMLGLARMLATVVDDEPERDDGRTSRWAVLRSRPGRGGARPDDLALAASLVAACRARRVPLDVVHLATDDTLVPLAADDLRQTG